MKTQVCFAVGIVFLFLGWIPKIGAERVSWFLDNDFAHLYLTGKLVAAGINPYVIDLKPLYGEFGFAPTREIPLAGAPPALALVMALLAVLSPMWAYGLWTLLQVCSLLLGALILMRVVGLRCSGALPLGVLCAVVAPFGVFAHIRYGQTQALMFLFVALGVALLRGERRWMWRCGLILWGIATSLKLFTAPLLFVAWRYRGREGALWFAVGMILLCLPFGLWCGVDALWTFALRTLPYIQELSTAFDGNISLSGAIVCTQRIIWGLAVVSPRSVQVGCLLMFLPLLVLESREKKDILASTTTMLAASCLLSPTTWAHYLPLLTGGFIYVLASALQARRASSALWWVLGFYMCFGSVLGYVPRGDVITRVVSAWSGALVMMGMIVMITLARRRATVFA